MMGFGSLVLHLPSPCMTSAAGDKVPKKKQLSAVISFFLSGAWYMGLQELQIFFYGGPSLGFPIIRAVYWGD